MIGSMSAIRPCRWTGKIAFVRGVIAASIKAGSIVQVTGIDVDEDRLRAAVQNGGRRRDEGHRDRDDLVAGSNAGGKQRQMQRRRPAVDGEAVPDIAIGGKMLLECRDLRPQHELRAFDGARDRRIDFRLDLTGIELSNPETVSRHMPPELTAGRQARSIKL